MRRKSTRRWLNQPLSEHQENILRYYIAGWDTHAIAQKFNISYSSVHSNLETIQHKFNAPSRRTLAILALYDRTFTFEELLPLTITALHTQFLDDHFVHPPVDQP